MISIVDQLLHVYIRPLPAFVDMLLLLLLLLLLLITRQPVENLLLFAVSPSYKSTSFLMHPLFLHLDRLLRLLSLRRRAQVFDSILSVPAGLLQRSHRCLGEMNGFFESNSQPFLVPHPPEKVPMASYQAARRSALQRKRLVSKASSTSRCIGPPPSRPWAAHLVKHAEVHLVGLEVVRPMGMAKRSPQWSDFTIFKVSMGETLEPKESRDSDYSLVNQGIKVTWKTSKLEESTEPCCKKS
ncbi:hypothetical protein IWX50DRAFT_680136 [Phyllosticta citricarpa]